MNSQHTQSRPLVLVVEDEKPLQAAVSSKLETEGFDSITVDSVEGALDALRAEPAIQAIWLDHYLLGEKDGLDLVEQIKQSDSEWKSIPVFLVSNTASPDKVKRYLHLGVNEYYVKSSNKLLDIITDIKETLGITV